MLQNFHSRSASSVLLFNCSPRLDRNTMHVLKEFKRGAESKGANVEIFNLYSMKFSGCCSCLECKKKGRPAGCVMHDKLSPILDKVDKCTGFAIGTPLYMSNFAAAFYPFFERLIYSHVTYSPDRRIKTARKINTGLVVTGGVNLERYEKESWPLHIHEYNYLNNVYGPCKLVSSINQCLTPDATPYDMKGFNMEQIHKWVKDHDAETLKQAFELGVHLTTKHD